MTTVWIYVDTDKAIGDVDHLKVFASEAAVAAWFTVNDPEGVAFEYELAGSKLDRRLPVEPEQFVELVGPVLAAVLVRDVNLPSLF
jgi:hypothetical protein